MTKYRLYTSDVAEGITDFNDDTYIIIHSSEITTDYCIIIDTSACYKPFIVAYKVKHHKLNSIDWVQGEYFDNLEDAYMYLLKKEYEFIENK